MRIFGVIFVSVFLVQPPAVFADPIDDILQQRGPLFRKRIELTNALSKLDYESRMRYVEKFRSEYGSIQKYQQMETRLEGLARQVRDATVALNTEADRLASKLPTVAAAKAEFLTRQTMRLAIDAVDTQVAAQVVAIAPTKITVDAVLANVKQARKKLYDESVSGVTPGIVTPSMLLGTAFAGVDDQARNFAIQQTAQALQVWIGNNKKLTDAAEKLKTESNKAASRFQSKITEIGADIAAANNVARAAQEALRSVPSDQKAEQYRKLFDSVLSNAERSRVINEAFFGHLDQVVAVTDAAKQLPKLADQIKALNDGRSTLLDGMREMTGTIAGVATGLQAVGLSPELAKAVNKGAQYAQVAQNVISNLASGNWVGAALGAAGILGGGGGPSQEEVYHQEIMQGIHQILENQRIMMQGINDLLKGQQEILKQIHDLAVQIQENQRETLYRFDRLDREIIDVKLNLIELQATDLNQCAQLQNLNTREWEVIVMYLNSGMHRRPAYRACKEGIRRLIKTPIEPPSSPTSTFGVSYFRLDNNPGDLVTPEGQAAIISYRSQIDDVFSYFDEVFPDGDTRRIELKRLWAAPFRASEYSDVPKREFGKGDLQNAFPTKINYGAVTKAVGYVLSAHQFMDLENANGLFQIDVSAASLYDGPADVYGFSIADNLAALQKLEKLTDLAAAQQALLAGISLFPKMFERLGKDDPLTVKLLKNHPTIAANYVRWYLRNKPSRPVPSVDAAYAFAYQSEDVNYMRGVVNGMDIYHKEAVEAEKCSDDRYAPIPRGWSVLIAPCLYVALPTVAEFTGDTFLFTAGFYDMHDAKVKLQDAISHYSTAQMKDGRQVVDDELFQYAIKRSVM